MKRLHPCALALWTSVCVLPATASPAQTASSPETSDETSSTNPTSRGSYAGEWRLSLQTEGAVGFSGSGFGNFLMGPRLDRYFSDTIAFGLSLEFVNLKGKDGRVKNALPEARLEYRIPLSDSVAAPFTYGMGFLANNGPTIHFTGGIDLVVGDDWSLGAEAGPMGWFTHDELVWSLNAGLALGMTL
jgi:hypothetical protein